MPNSPDLFTALEAAQQEIQEERRALDVREAALQRAREELEHALGNGAGSASPLTRTRAGVKQKAAQHWLDAVQDLLAREGAMRQADIGHRLSTEMDRNVNSGTVTLAVQQLEDAGVIRALPEKERGSVVWELAQKQSSPRGTGRRMARSSN